MWQNVSFKKIAPRVCRLKFLKLDIGPSKLGEGQLASHDAVAVTLLKFPKKADVNWRRALNSAGFKQR